MLVKYCNLSTLTMASGITRWITSNELRDIIKGSGKPLIDYAVVDVRDADFDGGNIPNCIHIPSHLFDERVDGLVERLKSTPLVVFHCYWSQQRGPQAARIFREARDGLLTPEQISPQEICILRGGFAEFQGYFKAGTLKKNYDPELVENYRASVWDPSVVESGDE
ncbi:Rhodanese-like domain-containing protein [Cantharellus anzutake]|uniref:Rhodanese-like domain-containing protein n=1 Tax=Cantharellus anzutake TaxID=1750568 RepID=UPI0019035F2E|nr:Rhodanese-like domain-containing protein [Cantharellus anzutake]KAF8315750.1 Rhodanese-like domain-containing protein [Cantharellus anzutake]